MPFEIAPQVEAPAKVGEFQDVADAMLRGCKQHPMGTHSLFSGGRTCAQGAAFIGAGVPLSDDPLGPGMFEAWLTPFGKRLDSAVARYKAKYGTWPHDDNNNRHLTREQIAARIAAL